MPPLPGLSPVTGKSVVACFDGGPLSSDGGLLVLQEVKRRLGVAARLAGCLKDPRDPSHIVHALSDIIGFRMLAIAAGYEDGNDDDRLRHDPVFKMALERAPSERDLWFAIDDLASAGEPADGLPVSLVGGAAHALVVEVPLEARVGADFIAAVVDEDVLHAAGAVAGASPCEVFKCYATHSCVAA
jgi:hypothetical protein